ncbi:DUF2875 family protein [Rugamonas sp. CCM 8940]|uniref:DUF2875 family protein n=1 Tax=Rugamonas sp. CCM 8940 TaxID=2765359 RepID=UPI0018F78C83|nr:DUF2875 family protein [Rugamonas sp. CCM 8940]
MTAVDSVSLRDGYLPLGAARLVKDGYYIPEMPDAAATFVLARRERVDPVRAYVWDDQDNNFVEEEFRQMYYKLMETVPTDKKRDSQGVHFGRQPTVEEWLPAAAAFAKNPEIHASGHRKYGVSWTPYQNTPPKTWKPTPWFPIPWNREQLATFDDLPSLGFIHRPTFVKFLDAEGHPIKRRDQRLQVLTAGWQEALQTLPEAERAKGPARVVAATDNQQDQLVALTSMLYHYESAGGPEIDINKTAQFINTDRRLGNTGAATFFVQMALGVMGSYREGGISAAINLRDPNEASIIFISPPSAEKRKSQQDPFEHHVQPMIDPQNYVAPSVEGILDAQRKQANGHADSPASAPVGKAVAGKR